MRTADSIEESKPQRILRHAAWYLMISGDIHETVDIRRRRIGEAFDILMNLAMSNDSR